MKKSPPKTFFSPNKAKSSTCISFLFGTLEQVTFIEKSDPSDNLEDSCGNCIIQYTPPTPYLKPDCTASPLQVNYEHVKYYDGKVNCGNLFLEADIGGVINVPPTVSYPNDEIDVNDNVMFV